MSDPTGGKGGMKIRPVIAWYDMWIGAYVDRSKHEVYVFPVPCLGFVVSSTRCKIRGWQFWRRPHFWVGGQRYGGGRVTNWLKCGRCGVECDHYGVAVDVEAVVPAGDMSDLEES